MGNSDSAENDTDKGPLFALMFLPGFVTGLLVAVVLLVTVPKLYRCCTKLGACLICSSSQESFIKVEEDTHVEQDCTDGRSTHYMEIDEKKTRTFGNQNHALSRPKGSENTAMPDGRRYEKCMVGNKTHRYSDLDIEASGQSRTQHTSTTNNYEPFSPGQLGNSREKIVSNHDYFILEPGSDKRLPVKPFECKSEALPLDPGHVYFILEPGTNKVTPLSQQNLTKNETRTSNGRDSGHIYFVLEPMKESAESETLAYAVNDVATSPSYFLLEKAERST